MKKIKNYHIGLDIGTSSIGFAVIDDHNKIIHKKGKNIIGARLFNEGKTAAERRSFRTTRRRYKRRQWRINLLNQLFINNSNLIKEDPNFFKRLTQSNISNKDPRKKYFGSLLFPENEKGDSDFYRNGDHHLTIYHLRHKLATENKKADIKEIYLAIHHIVKYRGNFLDNTPVSSFEASELHLDELFPLINNLYDNLQIKFHLNTSNYKKIGNVLLSHEIKNVDKKKQLSELVLNNSIWKNIQDKDIQKNVNKVNQNIGKEIAALIIGYKSKINVLLNMVDADKITLKLSDANSDDQLLSIIDDNNLNDNQKDILLTLKKIYSRYKLNQIIPNGKTFSEAMIDRYHQHHDQLSNLKNLISLINNKELQNDFKLAYALYIGNLNQENFNQDDFKNLLNNIKGNATKSIKSVNKGNG
ncbi:hypothetical protein WR164_14140 [Philodulcilactobacillus myokoensis]|uniref:Type II CRISPR RNA-guided endonuclease Cas9 n=1 Tax=Philodulcilactobacillus myokoensis TaxID=2929573 RepID=A0A9W6ET45_9LACO|nr:type II CRISPR RNA-guided endonuclease Cas9 [Philodulcilactobacillus myokoensis]GLB47435.1 hypothetical protein WR164_14140 [Philodulcilactobacillus myokoensis]